MSSIKGQRETRRGKDRSQGGEPVGRSFDDIIKPSGDLFFLPDQYSELRWILVAWSRRLQTSVRLFLFWQQHRRMDDNTIIKGSISVDYKRNCIKRSKDSHESWIFFLLFPVLRTQEPAVWFEKKHHLVAYSGIGSFKRKDNLRLFFLFNGCSFISLCKN